MDANVKKRYFFFLFIQSLAKGNGLDHTSILCLNLLNAAEFLKVEEPIAMQPIFSYQDAMFFVLFRPFSRFLVSFPKVSSHINLPPAWWIPNIPHAMCAVPVPMHPVSTFL